MAGPDEERARSHERVESADERGAASRSAKSGDLQLPRAEMLDLASKAAELLVERIENLPGETAWEGEFRRILDDQLMEDGPENGRPAAEVIESVNRL